MKQEAGKALLVVFMDPKAAVEEKFNEWCAAYQSAAPGRAVPIAQSY